MGLQQIGLRLYRQTVKRFQPAHLATHWLMTHTVIPFLERTTRFKTIPDDPFWFRLELLRGRHEPETAVLFNKLIQPGMTVLDIGAHVGYYARRFARLVGRDGRVIAFEPHPRTYSTLQRNVAPFSNVTTLPVALAAEPGHAELHDYLVMSASGSLNYDPGIENLQKAQQSSHDVAPRIGDQFHAKKYVVQTRRVDDCLEELGIKEVDVVKMDIEGAELGALRGMSSTIRRSPNMALVMEYNPQALHGFGHDPIEALFEVMDMGFRSLQAIEQDGSLKDIALDLKSLRAKTDALMAEMGVINVLLKRS